MILEKAVSHRVHRVQTNSYGDKLCQTMERFYLGDIPDADGSNSDLIDRLLKERANAMQEVDS